MGLKAGNRADRLAPGRIRGYERDTRKQPNRQAAWKYTERYGQAVTVREMQSASRDDQGERQFTKTPSGNGGRFVV